MCVSCLPRYVLWLNGAKIGLCKLTTSWHWNFGQMVPDVEPNFVMTVVVNSWVNFRLACLSARQLSPSCLQRDAHKSYVYSNLAIIALCRWSWGHNLKVSPSRRSPTLARLLNSWRTTITSKGVNRANGIERKRRDMAFRLQTEKQMKYQTNKKPTWRDAIQRHCLQTRSSTLSQDKILFWKPRSFPPIFPER